MAIAAATAVTGVLACLIGAAVIAQLNVSNHRVMVVAKAMPNSVALAVHVYYNCSFCVLLRQLREVRKEFQNLPCSLSSNEHRDRSGKRRLEKYLYLYLATSVPSFASWLTLSPVVSFEQCLLVSTSSVGHWCKIITNLVGHILYECPRGASDTWLHGNKAVLQFSTGGNWTRIFITGAKGE